MNQENQLARKLFIVAHILMTEGWKSKSGNLILPLLKKMGHTYTFVTLNSSLYKSADYQGEHPLFENAENTIEVDTNNIQYTILERGFSEI